MLPPKLLFQPISDFNAWLVANHEFALQTDLLHKAVRANRFNVVLLLLHKDFDINGLDNSGKTALHYAVQDPQRGHILNLLLVRGALLIADSKGNTPLHEAVLYKNIEALNYLFKYFKKPDFTVRNHQQQTVLQIALINCFLDTLVHLLECYGAQVELDELAQIRDNQELPQNIRNNAFLALVARGKVDVIPEDYDSAQTDSRGDNSILLAVGSGRPEALARLIEAGHKFITRNNTEANVFEKAILSGQPQMLQLLTRSKEQGGYGLSFDALFSSEGHSYNDIYEPFDDRGMHPLFLAVAHGYEQIVRLLVLPKEQNGYGIAIDTVINGFNASIIAAARGQDEMYKLLVSSEQQGGYGVSPFKDNNDWQPVLAATAGGHLSMLALLSLSEDQGGYGQSLDVRDSEGYDPVLMAITFSQTQVLMQLLLSIEKGGYSLSLDTQNEAEMDPVALAVHAGEMTTLQILLQPIEYGGHGLAFTNYESNYQLLAHVVRTANIFLLELLLRSTEQDGYGLTLEQPFNLLAEAHQEHMFTFVFFHEFQRLQKINCDEALVWIKTVFDRCQGQIRTEYFGTHFIRAYNRWLSTAIASAKCKQQDQNILKNLTKIIQGHHAYIPTGHYELADWFWDTQDYISAFKEYKKIYDTELHIAAPNAGYQLANLIYTRKILLKADGSLDEVGSKDNIVQMQHTSMQELVIKAYEYLEINTSGPVNKLRQLFDSILGNKTKSSFRQEQDLWQPQVLIQYQDYYIQKKNYSMLAHDVFVRSVNHYLQVDSAGMSLVIDQQLEASRAVLSSDNVNHKLFNLLVTYLHRMLSSNDEKVLEIIKHILAGNKDYYRVLFEQFYKVQLDNYDESAVSPTLLVNAKGSSGNTALHLAVKKEVDFGKALLNLILPFCVELILNDAGNNPLHEVTMCDNKLMAFKLLRHFKKPDLSARNDKQQTVLDLAPTSSWLQLFLECYDANIDLDDLIKIANSPKAEITTRKSAFLALVARGKLDGNRKEYDQKIKDSKGNDAVLLAVRSGQPQILMTLIDAGYFLETRNIYGIDPVLMAISQGHAHLLKLLTMPKEKGGHGLSLACFDNHKNGPMAIAMHWRQVGMLKLLSKPIEFGGYGLKFEGAMESYLRKYQQTFVVFEYLFYHELDRLKKINCEEALDWIKHVCRHYKKHTADPIFKNNLKDYFKQWLIDIIALAKNPTLNGMAVMSDLEKIHEALEEFAPGEGDFQLANAYLETNDYTNAFSSYLSVFNNKQSACKAQAGCHLADLIFTGNVLLDNNGTLIEDQADKTISTSIQDGSNPDLQQRAIMSYEYLPDNEVHANALQDRLDDILAGEKNLTTSQKLVCWQSTTLLKYQTYYLNRENYAMLAKERFVLSSQHFFRHVMSQQVRAELSYAVTNFFESSIPTREQENTLSNSCQSQDFLEPRVL